MKKEARLGGVRMWRIWRLTESNELEALVSHHIWHKGMNEVPLEDRDKNGAGYYGFDSIKRIPEQEKSNYDSWLNYSQLANQGKRAVVIGSIIGLGRLKCGPWGARATIAIPEYLVLTPEDMDYNIRLMETAVKYGMTPCTWDQALTLRTGMIPFREDMIK